MLVNVQSWLDGWRRWASGARPTTSVGISRAPPSPLYPDHEDQHVHDNAIERILAGNKKFVNHTNTYQPDFLHGTGKGQTPEVLWLGCSDSRVPETTVCNCRPGDIFVHRNIANVIKASDTSANSVLDFSVGVVGVKHVVVCGHTRCGGANASLGDADLGDALNTWLEPVRELRRKHQAELDAIVDTDERITRMAELNVHLSVEAVLLNATVQKAIKERGLTVHGLLYDIPKGELKVLDDPTCGHEGQSEHH